MTDFDHDRYCAEIVAQSRLLESRLRSADLSAPVAACPGWNIARLVRHLGGGHRWSEETVRTRSSEFLPDGQIRQVSDAADVDPAELGAWLAEGAGQLAATLRESGPDARVWTPVRGSRAGFYARRMAHETVVHRADAELALGAEFTVPVDLARDTVEEWLELGSLPDMFEYHPEMRALLGPGRTLLLHPTDTAPDPGGAAPGWEPAWLVDLTGEAITWRRARPDEPARTTLRGPLTGLLLLVYRRLTADEAGVEVLGDRELFDFWWQRISFG